jgi:cbb3-type cytochrome oxidase subunit 3
VGFSAYAYAAIGLAVIGFIIWLYRKGAKSGRQGATIAQQEATIETVQKAKDAGAAMDSNSDPTWSERVRSKYRRP